MILYAVVGGITELFPVSFSGHAVILQSVFNIPGLIDREGAYIRAAISLGTILAIYLSFFHEARDNRITLRRIRRRDPRRKTATEIQLELRVNLLAIIAVIPVLFSFLFFRKGQSITALSRVAGFFVLYTIFILLCTRGPVGQREERDITVFDSILVGLFRMLCVFPGLSAVGVSLCIGRARGFSNRFNLKFTYLLSLLFEIVSFIYYMIVAFRFGTFYGSLLIPCVLVALISAVVGYLTLTYFRNFFMGNKFRGISYYCVDVAAIACIIAIINT